MNGARDIPDLIDRARNSENDPVSDINPHESRNRSSENESEKTENQGPGTTRFESSDSFVQKDVQLVNGEMPKLETALEGFFGLTKENIGTNPGCSVLSQQIESFDHLID